MRWVRQNGAAIVEYDGLPKSATTMDAGGWTAYAGTLPLSRLSIVDGVAIELTATTEWVSTEIFVAALAVLVDAETLAASLADAAKLKTGLVGLALLTTDAAPGGMINLLDSRVEPWLGAFGLTVEQVRTQIAALAETEDGNE